MNWKDNLRNLELWLLKNKRTLAWVFCSLIVFVGFIASQIRIVVITSGSIPYEVCLQVYHAIPKKYDLCAFIYNGQRLVKYIVGEEGDKIINLADAIYVDGFRIGKAVRTNKLTPIEDCEIPRGYVFVSGRHPASLDSRYKEFGFVKISDLEGKVFGLVKRNDFQEDTFVNWHD